MHLTSCFNLWQYNFMNFSRLQFILAAAALVLLPVFFLPLGSDFFDFQKQYLLLLIVILLAGLFLARGFLTGRFSLSLSIFDKPVLLLLIAVLLSFLLNAPNKLDSLAFPLGTGSFLLLCFFYFILLQSVEKEKAPLLPLFLYAGTGFVSFFTLISFGLRLGGIETQIPLPQFLFNPSFSFLGGMLTQLVVLVITTAGVLTYFLSRARQNRFSLFISCLAALNLTGLLLTVYLVFFVLKPAFLPLTSSWVIFAENLKNLRNALFGVGPGNYLTAFTLGRPLNLNLTPLWNLRFGSSSSFFLQAATELGLVGLAPFILLLIPVFFGRRFNLSASRLSQFWGEKTPEPQESPDNENRLLLPPLALSFLLLLFLPASLMVLFTFFTLLTLYAAGSKREINLNISKEIITAVGAVLLAALLYFGGRAYLGEFYYGQALDAVANNQGGGAYNRLILAIQTNPYAERYRLSYSQLNLALANSLAAKKDLTDQDRTTITQLVQQAINEGKAAVSLNPQKVTNWENLASIYSALVNIVQGSDTWAITSYDQAILLDPANPLLRLSEGGMFLQTKKFADARDLFRAAVNLKPDWPNAYYNLSAAFRELGDYQSAVAAMEKTLTLVPFDSNDYRTAKAELDKLNEKLPKPTAAPAAPTGQPETLAPAVTPGPQFPTPLPLPSEMAPPPANQQPTQP